VKAETLSLSDSQYIQWRVQLHVSRCHVSATLAKPKAGVLSCACVIFVLIVDRGARTQGHSHRAAHRSIYGLRKLTSPTLAPAHL
jgi:hypothetical protein